MYDYTTGIWYGARWKDRLNPRYGTFGLGHAAHQTTVEDPHGILTWIANPAKARDLTFDIFFGGTGLRSREV